MQLHCDELLDLTVIHGDGTTTAAKKGGDNIGFKGGCLCSKRNSAKQTLKGGVSAISTMPKPGE
jgi:hypothetical protein